MEAEATTGDNNDNSVGVWHRRNHGNDGKRRDVTKTANGDVYTDK